MARQARYVEAAAEDTARTILFDVLGPVDWPRGVDGRALRNRFSDANPEQLLGKAKTTILDHSHYQCCCCLLELVFLLLLLLLNSPEG